MTDMETSVPRVEKVPGSVYRTLLQFALLGNELGKVSLSMDIAETLIELCPDLPHASIVLAMNKFGVGQHDESIRSLEQILKKFPDSQLGKAMLATCLQATSQAGWQELFESVINDGRDEHAIGLACASLGRENQFESVTLPAVSIPSTAIWG